VLEGNSLLHGQEVDAYGDAGYQGIHKRPDVKLSVTWYVAMRPGKRRALVKSDPLDQLTDKIEKAKAGIRAKVEHPFRVIIRQFGYVKTRYRGLKKNTAQLVTLFVCPICGWCGQSCKGSRDECVCRQGKWWCPWPTQPQGTQKSLPNSAH
jgi:IS5 family transposase